MVTDAADVLLILSSFTTMTAEMFLIRNAKDSSALLH